MINRLEEPTSGEILVNGDNILLYNKETLRKYRQKTAMIFQHFNLLSSRTVFQNVALPLEIAKTDKKTIKEKVEKLLKLVDLYEKKDVYVNNLSGGQKQRVAIARTLATNPNILLSDESTSSLDPITANAILELLKKINKELGITIVLITHQMEVIKKICDRVVVMKDGIVIESAITKELFLNPKTEFTKELIKNLKNEIQIGKKNSLELHFDGEQANIPYTSQLTRKFNINVNILGSTINTLADGSKVGNLSVEIESDNIEEPVNWLLQNGVKVEVIK